MEVIDERVPEANVFLTEHPPQNDVVEAEHLVYLDDLRRSGDTNMFGAALYLEHSFDLNRREARDVLTYWMDTFEQRHG